MKRQPSIPVRDLAARRIVTDARTAGSEQKGSEASRLLLVRSTSQYRYRRQSGSPIWMRKRRRPVKRGRRPLRHSGGPTVWDTGRWRSARDWSCSSIAVRRCCIVMVSQQFEDRPRSNSSSIPGARSRGPFLLALRADRLAAPSPRSERLLVVARRGDFALSQRRRLPCRAVCGWSQDECI
jgi:hypothetical protein